MYFTLTVPVDNMDCRYADISKAKVILGWGSSTDICVDLTTMILRFKKNQIKA
jgi:hypothetical protein